MRGGGVIFNNLNVGTIKNGKCVVKLKGSAVYEVYINGGLPGGRQDVTYYYENGVEDIVSYESGTIRFDKALHSVMNNTLTIYFSFTNFLVNMKTTSTPWTQRVEKIDSVDFVSPSPGYAKPNDVISLNYEEMPSTRLIYDIPVYDNNNATSISNYLSSNPDVITFNSIVTNGFTCYCENYSFANSGNRGYIVTAKIRNSTPCVDCNNWVDMRVGFSFYNVSSPASGFIFNQST